ncbi:MAG: MauE/DoxX family redox-associated membrane protein [Pseudomonadales bacterium]
MNTTFFCTISMLFLSYLFVTAGYQKLSNGNYLHKAISEYRVLPTNWSRGLARLLPIMELSAGIGLLIPPLHTAAVAVVCVLLLSYTGAIAVNFVRGRHDLDCGCAGPGEGQNVSGGLLARNAALFALALALASSPVSQRIPLDAIGFCFALLGALLSALIYHVFNQLLANQHKLRRIANHG